MVFIADLNMRTSFTPEDYIDFAESNIEFGDFDSLIDTAWALRALANDREFLINLYHDELKAIQTSVSGNILTPQSLTVARRQRFFIRANVWLTALSDPLHQKSEQTLYAYKLPHDHNFHFVSVGYYGPGYETDLFTYNFDSITGYIDEPVDLNECGRERLIPGRIMVYKANYDVHIQYEPTEISVSLNMIPLGDDIFRRPQFVFDVERGRVAGGVSDQVGSRIFLLDFFRHLHNENTISLHQSVSTEHPCDRTRGQALSVLEEIRPDEREYFRSVADSAALRFARNDLVHAGYSRQREG